MISKKKLAANRLNAKKSTGPKSAEGKARSSRNASTHGIFCADLVLPGEDKEYFELFREEFINSLVPQDMMELALVDEIVAAKWRLRRLRATEALMHQARADELLEARDDKAEELLEQLEDPFREKSDDDKVRQRHAALAQLSSKDAAGCATLAAMCIDDRDGGFERLGRYEERLQGIAIRCSRELRQLRKDRHKDLKPSIYSAQVQAKIRESRESEEEAAEKRASRAETRDHNEVADTRKWKLQNEPTAVTSPGGAERSGKFSSPESKEESEISPRRHGDTEARPASS